MYNPWVGELQRLLKAKGKFAGTVDSDWQGKTDVAVRAFQRENNLEVDGVVGQATWEKLLA
jgi:peptidoglycan hydrolase-like protein with peptidoglycan-binding domain